MMRIGQGYDAHRLAPNRLLVLGGVTIPYEKGLLGHSDADVLLHAIIDALLGAAALGDIGELFPDSDPRYRDISSTKLLEEVSARIRAIGYTVVNVDATLIAQAPAIARFRNAMQCRIAHALQADVSRVNVKATTEEGMGFTGSGEGIAAMAVCLLETAAKS